jgi:signal transduction histidine kinase
MNRVQLNRKVHFIAALLISFAFQGRAQGVPDTILTRIFALPNDSSRVVYLNDLSLQLVTTAPQTAYSIGYYALGLSSNLKNPTLEAATLENMGILSAHRGENQAALTFYFKAEPLYRSLGDSLSVGYLYRNIGVAYAQGGRSDSAFHGFVISLAYLQGEGSRYYRALTELELAKALYAAKKPVKARYYINRALPAFEAESDMQALAASYNLLGLLKYDEGSPESGDYFFRAREISERMGDSVGAAIHAFNMGLSFERSGDAQRALEQFNQVGKLLDRYGQERLLAALHVNRGLVLLGLQPKDTAALGETQRGITLARKMNDDRTVEKGLSGLATHFKSTGNLQKALEYQELLIQLIEQREQQSLEDMMRQVDNSNLISQQSKEIDLLKLEEKINAQMLEEKDRQRYRLYGGMGLLALAVLIFLWMNRHIRHQNRALEEQYSEIRDQRKKLSKLNKSKDRLFAIIGHDLRGPIGNISRLLTLIPTERDFLTEESQSTLEVAKAGMAETHNLLENLLIWAKSQNENIQLDIRKQKIGPLIDRSIQLQKAHINLKHIRVTSEFPAEMMGQFDYDILYTVIRNLLSNAVKFAPEGSEIKIQAHPAAQGKGIEIDVVDQGSGVPQQIIEALEKPHEDHEPQNGNIKSNGMGLKLCKDLLQFNDGKLQVMSSDTGTRVRVSLPG